MKVDEIVDNFPRKHKLGFTKDEINQLVASVPELNLNMEAFESALFGITVAMIDNEHIYYPHDVRKAFLWGLGIKIFI